MDRHDYAKVLRTCLFSPLLHIQITTCPTKSWSAGLQADWNRGVGLSWVSEMINNIPLFLANIPRRKEIKYYRNRTNVAPLFLCLPYGLHEFGLSPWSSAFRIACWCCFCLCGHFLLSDLYVGSPHSENRYFSMENGQSMYPFSLSYAPPLLTLYRTVVEHRETGFILYCRDCLLLLLLMVRRRVESFWRSIVWQQNESFTVALPADANMWLFYSCVQGMR